MRAIYLMAMTIIVLDAFVGDTMCHLANCPRQYCLFSLCQKRERRSVLAGVDSFFLHSPLG